jgi:hypothetical protein
LDVSRIGSGSLRDPHQPYDDEQDGKAAVKRHNVHLLEQKQYTHRD